MEQEKAVSLVESLRRIKLVSYTEDCDGYMKHVPVKSVCEEAAEEIENLYNKQFLDQSNGRRVNNESNIIDRIADLLVRDHIDLMIEVESLRRQLVKHKQECDELKKAMEKIAKCPSRVDLMYPIEEMYRIASQALKNLVDK